ncbi:hypothetical protein [Flagellimonas sp.]|uniref:hypothetical protein n=1 Tax=Flagellimonas sp. TaxID=2058762 RepID=UPI003B5C65A9
MTKTDLFRVIIKIFGIYCFIDVLFQLLPSISFSGGFDAFSFTFNLIYMIVMGLIAFLLLFQTDRLVKLFRLEKGFDTPTIDAKHLSANGLFKLGLIVMGLLMIADNIAPFLNFCYLIFKEQVSADGLTGANNMALHQHLYFNRWVVCGLNVLVGIIILTNYKWISKLFLKNEKKLGDNG